MLEICETWAKKVELIFPANKEAIMPNVSIETLESLLADAKELEQLKGKRRIPFKEEVCSVMDPNFPVSLRARLKEAFGEHYCRGMRDLIDKGLRANGY